MNQFQCSFSYPWEKVVSAAVQKYPNPENDKVTGIDVISQQVRNGQLHSERILETKFNVMSWASKVVDFKKIRRKIFFEKLPLAIPRKFQEKLVAENKKPKISTPKAN